MKKSKVLIATLALSAALMGTGYAYWTKTLTVDATVTSAKFDVYFSSADVVRDAGSETGTGINNFANEVKDKGTINNAKDNITYEWDNIYPGSQVTLKFTIKNDSTIPVHAKPIIKATYVQAEKSKDADQSIKDALKYTVKIDGTQCGNAQMTEAEMKTTLEAIDAKIDKEAEVPVEILVEMPTDVTDLKAEGDKVTLKATMVWGQFNDGDPKESPAPTSPAPPTSPAE